MSESNEIRDIFFVECEELLEAAAEGLQEIANDLSDGVPDSETINAVFRAVHSIKGGASAFELVQLVEFAHRFETAMDGIRSGNLIADAKNLEVFLGANDHLADLVAAARDGLALDQSKGVDISAALDATIGKMPGIAAPEENIAFVPMGINLNLDHTEPDAGPDRFVIRFKPRDELYANGHDPSLLLRSLGELGTLETRIEGTTFPSFDDYDPVKSYLTWDIRLTTRDPEHVIHEVFDFAADCCTLEVEPETEVILADLPTRSLPDIRLVASVVPDSDSSGTVGAPEAKKGNSGGGDPKANSQTTPMSGAATVRVSLDRVDRLINVVSELVINQAMLAQCAADAGIAKGKNFAAGLSEFKRLSGEIQEGVMAIRAQPVKPLFQRMARIVREASSATGKPVRLVTEGEATEVDKTIIERLADPLTHMVRNAVDHGLESPENRLAAGKPELGIVTLSATHRSGRVIIDVSDDGAGIDRERVRHIAIEKGLIADQADLSETEIDNLLFMPGFSTVDEVSSLSGRGVGMDVVKSSIQALGGRVTIVSTPGQGSRFSISLPLTLAVVEGMVVDVADQTMVVPLTAILETLRPAPSMVHQLGTGETVVGVRGEFVPVVDLGVFYGYRTHAEHASRHVLLLVETEHGRTCALAVDAIHDQRQVVIKGLEGNYGRIPGVAAATILGDGRIALIVDSDAIVETSFTPRGQPELLYAAEG